MTCAVCGGSLPEQLGVCPSCGLRPSPFTLSQGDTLSTGAARGQPVSTASFDPGQSFGERYTVVEELGSGGMGQVYKALDRKLGKTVALKLIRREAAAHQGALERFRRELSLAQEVTHPNVCRVHDLGEVHGIVYISMEYVGGQTLEDLIQSVGHLSPRQTVGLARQVCAGLEAIHERAIVHRDLKPGNVMVDRSGHALVMDFGLAYHPGDDRLTNAGAVLGTLAYLSPEQARGHVMDVRADIYSLGLILYEMLTGRRPPGDGNSIPLALREAGEPCPPPSHFMPDVPPALDGVVLKCLSRDPARRYSSASELGQALSAITGALSSGTSPLFSGSRAFARSRPRAAGIAAAVLVATVAAVVVARPWAWLPRAPRPVSVALLPLAYEGPEESAYLKHVVPLVVGEALRGAEGLDVAPFASSRTFAHGESSRSVARQLGVGWVVQGRINAGQGRYALTLRLLSGADDRETWSQTLNGETRELLAGADRIAGAVAASLGVVPAGLPRASRHDHGAVEAYLEGKALLEGWDVASNPVRAEGAFRRAIEKDAAFGEAHAGLALALWRRYEQQRAPELVEPALAAARRAVSLAGSLPEAHLALGVVLLGRGRSPEAALSFQRAHELAPADDGVCRRIADAYAELKRTDDADRFYRRAIELRPEYWENYNRRGIFCLRVGKLAEAKELFRKVVDLRPEGDLGYSNLAGAHILAGELEQAEPLLQAALRIQPSASAHNNLGFVYYGTGRFEEAARSFRAATQAGSEKASYWGNLGDAYRQMGLTKEARSAYGRAIELGQARLDVNPADTQARAALAMRLAGARQCGEARRHAAQAAGEGAADPTVHYYAALAYAVCGDRAAAIRHTTRAIQGGVVADVRTNPDLKPLLADPEVRRLLP